MSTNKIKNNLSYYIFALLVTVFIFILWQGFREKPMKAGSQQNNPALNVSGPKIDPNQKVFFASNGKDTAYKIKKGDKWSVLFGNVESKEYDYVSGAVFSSDGTQFAFSAENAGQAYVVVNNTQEINAYQKAGYIVFNSTGTIIAFVASKSTNSYVIITSAVGSSITTPATETQSYEQIGTATDINGNIVSIIFSPDGEEVAYIIEKDGGVCIVVDGEEGEVYDSITNLTLNDDGTLTYSAEDENQIITIINDAVVSTDDTTSNTNNDSTTETPTSTSTDYKYKISTDKDINRSGTSTDITTTCPAGQNCNF
jgi:hypothetical protein